MTCPPPSLDDLAAAADVGGALARSVVTTPEDGALGTAGTGDRLRRWAPEVVPLVRLLTQITTITGVLTHDSRNWVVEAALDRARMLQWALLHRLMRLPRAEADVLSAGLLDVVGSSEGVWPFVGADPQAPRGQAIDRRAVWYRFFVDHVVGPDTLVDPSEGAQRRFDWMIGLGQQTERRLLDLHRRRDDETHGPLDHWDVTHGLDLAWDFLGHWAALDAFLLAGGPTDRTGERLGWDHLEAGGAVGMAAQRMAALAQAWRVAWRMAAGAVRFYSSDEEGRDGADDTPFRSHFTHDQRQIRQGGRSEHNDPDELMRLVDRRILEGLGRWTGATSGRRAL